MSTLVILESPTKAHTVKGFLGKGYKVIASNGHVRDLPKSTLGVDIENNFENPAKVKEFIKNNPEIRTQFSKILADCQSKDHKFAGFSQSYARISSTTSHVKNMSF